MSIRPAKENPVDPSYIYWKAKNFLFRNYFLYNTFLNFRYRKLSENDLTVQEFLSTNNVKKPLLLAGPMKSGNTWARFVIFNYYNIINHDAEDTLTHKELRTQYNPYYLGEEVHPTPIEGFPVLFRTHRFYQKIFDVFSKTLYVYRHPLDTLISEYWFFKKRLEPFSNYPVQIRKKLYDLDYYVKFNLSRTLTHHKRSFPKVDVILSYEKRKLNPYEEYLRAFQEMGIEVDEKALKKSIELSSFKNIKKMGTKKDQKSGARADFVGEFARSGKIKQYESELLPETITYFKKQIRKYKIEPELYEV